MTDENKIEVVTLYNKDLIISETRDTTEMYNHARHVIQLRDEGVRKALSELGWISPEQLQKMIDDWQEVVDYGRMGRHTVIHVTQMIEELKGLKDAAL